MKAASGNSPSPSLKEQNANSLLHSSVIKGNKSTLKEAIKLGCNLKSQSKYGDPPLVAAAGVDPYTTHDSKSGKDSMLEIFQMLLERPECDLNGRGAGGETSLHRAMAVRAQNRVRFLLERGCDVDIRDSRGQTALFNAMSFSEGLQLLLQYEPLLDVFDSDGFTPLMHAMMSESPQSLESLKVLTAAGANINAVSAKARKSVLMVTLREDGSIPRSDQRVEKSLFLISHGINVNHKDKSGQTALHYAMRSECVALVELLIKNKASPDSADSKDQSVVSLAKEIANPEIIRLVERAVDKSSRLLPYEESLSHLESLYSAVNLDEALSSTFKQSLISLINQLENSLQEVITTGRGADTMSVEHKRILASKHNELCEEMMPLYVIPYLHREKVLTESDMDVISGLRARKLMCVKLLELLPHRGSRAFPTLLHALSTSKQHHVCEILKSNDSK